MFCMTSLVSLEMSLKVGAPVAAVSGEYRLADLGPYWVKHSDKELEKSRQLLTGIQQILYFCTLLSLAWVYDKY